jgi:hypothetical protein
MTASTNELTQRALFLRNAAPEQFAEFLAALRAYVADLALDVTDAGNDDVLRMQGRALTARVMLRVLEECDKHRRT